MAAVAGEVRTAATVGAAAARAVVGVGGGRHGQHRGGAEDRDGDVAPDDRVTARFASTRARPESCMSTHLFRPPGAGLGITWRKGAAGGLRAKAGSLRNPGARSRTAARRGRRAAQIA